MGFTFVLIFIHLWRKIIKSILTARCCLISGKSCGEKHSSWYQCIIPSVMNNCCFWLPRIQPILNFLWVFRWEIMKSLRFYSTCKISYLGTVSNMGAEKRKPLCQKRKDISAWQAWQWQKHHTVIWAPYPQRHMIRAKFWAHRQWRCTAREDPRDYEALLLCRAADTLNVLLLQRKREISSLLPGDVSKSSLRVWVWHIYLYWAK